MKHPLRILLIPVLIGLACNLPIAAAPATPTPEPTTTMIAAPTQAPASAVPATVAPNDLTAPPTPAAPGIAITIGNTSFVIPSGLADGATQQVIPAASGDQAAPWDVAPEHSIFTLSGYVLGLRQPKPEIFVYPAADYAAQNNGVADNINKIKALTSGAGMDVNNDTLPHVPFYNAAQVFAAQPLVIPFRSGNGVRFITQYAQDVSPITNTRLMYQFQGLTQDGKYYVVVIAPLSSAILSNDPNPDGAVPQGGVAFPVNSANPSSDMPAYFDAVTQKLNELAPESFNPSLSMLDNLIRTIQVTP